MEPPNPRPPKKGFVRRHWLTSLIVVLALAATCVDVVCEVGLSARDWIFSIKEGHVQFQSETIHAGQSSWDFESRDFRLVSPSIGDMPTFYLDEGTLELSVPIWLILVLAADWLILRAFLRVKPAPVAERSPLELHGALLNANVRKKGEEE